MIALLCLPGTSPVQGGGNSYDERLNNSICLVDMLRDNLRIAERDVKLTRKALEMLSDEERRLLEVMYIDRQKNGLQRLCEEFNVDERTIWRKLGYALNAYNAARHGER